MATLTNFSSDPLPSRASFFSYVWSLSPYLEAMPMAKTWIVYPYDAPQQSHKRGTLWAHAAQQLGQLELHLRRVYIKGGFGVSMLDILMNQYLGD